MTYRILSIDGGGIRGVIPAALIALLEDTAGLSVARAFDLVAGTSTGGLLGLGLTAPRGASAMPRYSAADMLDFYRRHGPAIFDRPLWKVLESPRGLREEKHSAEALERVLQELLGTTTLGDHITPTVVTTYDMGAPGARLLSDGSHPTMRSWQAARATSAAPTFFEPAVIGGAGYLDGAMIANSPAMLAVTLAIELGHPMRDIEVLSIGTGRTAKTINPHEAATWGLIEWAQPVFEVLMDGVATATHVALERMPLGKYTRIERQLVRGSAEMDDGSLANIAALELDAAETWAAYIDDFTWWAGSLNTPPAAERDTA